MKITQISHADLGRLLEGTRYEEKTRDLLRAVLCDGQEPVMVSNEYGVSRQRVNQLVKLFLSRHYSNNASDGHTMVRVSLELPERLATELSGMLDAFGRCRDQSKKGLAIDKAVVGVRGAARQLK